jgi:hypothetical protein
VVSLRDTETVDAGYTRVFHMCESRKPPMKGEYTTAISSIPCPVSGDKDVLARSGNAAGVVPDAVSGTRLRPSFAAIVGDMLAGRGDVLIRRAGSCGCQAHEVQAFSVVHPSRFGV